MAGLSIEIVTPAKVAFRGTAAEVQAPGAAGEFGVLPGHTAMLAVTRAGIVTLYGASSGGTQRLVVGPGFAEVGPDRVTMLVDRCEEAEKVDKSAAAADLQAAEARLASAEPGSEAAASARREMELAQARLDV